MGKYILETAGEIDWMAILPLLIFFTFFIGVLIYAFMFSSDKISHIEKLPLDEN